jgi:hypothetical protein
MRYVKLRLTTRNLNLNKKNFFLKICNRVITRSYRLTRNKSRKDRNFTRYYANSNKILRVNLRRKNFPGDKSRS